MIGAILLSLSMTAAPEPFCEFGPPDDMRPVSCLVEDAVLPDVLPASIRKFRISDPDNCGGNACATCWEVCWPSTGGRLCWVGCSCTFIEGGCYY